MKKFLERDDLPPATSTKLLQILNDPAKTRKLKIEIATTVEAMESFVESTQRLKQMEMLHMSNSYLTIQRHVYNQHTIIST